jgi:hypothetical protein
MKTQRVANLITDILHSAGVRRIYGVRRALDCREVIEHLTAEFQCPLSGIKRTSGDVIGPSAEP